MTSPGWNPSLATWAGVAGQAAAAAGWRRGAGTAGVAVAASAAAAAAAGAAAAAAAGAAAAVAAGAALAVATGAALAIATGVALPVAAGVALPVAAGVALAVAAGATLAVAAGAAAAVAAGAGVALSMAALIGEGRGYQVMTGIARGEQEAGHAQGRDAQDCGDQKDTRPRGPPAPGNGRGSSPAHLYLLWILHLLWILPVSGPAWLANQLGFNRRGRRKFLGPAPLIYVL
jgi:hypothetical protein